MAAKILLSVLLASTVLAHRVPRSPQDLYREHLEPSTGGKVPEAAHMRVEFNKIDAVGLDNDEAIRMVESLSQVSPELPDRAPASHGLAPGISPSFDFPTDFESNFPFSPVFDSARIKFSEPKSKPSKASNPYEVVYNSLFDDPFSDGFDRPVNKDTDNHFDNPVSVGYEPYQPAYSPAPYTTPTVSYAPEPYHTPSYAPEPYSPPQPAYHEPVSYAPPKPAYEPVAPVLLEKRPYEVKSVDPLPITVAETYTNFDCRTVPYANRHYADPEAGCEIYHYCHEDGKQDTFHCGYGTVFNEYLGTCDYKNNVHCAAGGQGYAPQPAAYHQPAAPYSPPAAYHEPAAPYSPPAVQYHEPAAPYSPPAVQYHEPAYQPTTYAHSGFGPFGFSS